MQGEQQIIAVNNYICIGVLRRGAKGDLPPPPKIG